MIRTEAKYKRRRLAVVIIFIAFILWALDATTPEMCKVPTDEPILSRPALSIIHKKKKGKK